MSINVSESIWAVICFFVLLFVLKKLLFDPIIRVMDARKAHVEDGLEAGRQAKKARDDNDAALLQARRDTVQQAGSILQQARTEDEKARQAVLAAARKENAQSLRDVRAELRAEEEAVTAQLEQEMPELVDALAAALLKEAR